jgi:hypothetical protein
VIAKTILDLFTLLPGATRSAVQNSDQPLKAFSDSLLAAAKSYSQDNNTIAASGRTAHRQNSVSADANTSVAVLNDADGLSAAAFESAQKTSPTPTSLQASNVGLTTPNLESTDAAAPSGQIQSAIEQSVGQSSVAQTAGLQTNPFAARLVRAAGFQTRSAGMRTLLAGSATSQIVSTGVATRPFRNVTVTRLASIQSDAAQTGAVQQAVIPVQTPHADSPTAQEPANSAAIPTPQNVASTASEQTQSVVAPAGIFVADASQQTAVRSSAWVVETPLAAPAMIQITPTNEASPADQSHLSPISTQTQSIAAPASTVQTSVSQSIAAQSDLAPAQTILAAPGAAQRPATGLAARFTQIVSAMGLGRPQSTFTHANAAPVTVSNGSVFQPDETQSSDAAAQSPLVATSATQANAAVAASQAISNPPTASTAAEPVFVSASAVSTSIPQPVNIQSKTFPVQMPSVSSATSQIASLAETSQSTSSLPTAAWNQTGSIFTLASILSTSIPRAGSVLSSSTPDQRPLAAASTAQNAPTAVTSQYLPNLPATTLKEVDSIFKPTNITSTAIPQPISIQSNIATAQTPVDSFAATQDASSISASRRPAQTTPSTGWAMPQPSVGPEDIAPATIPPASTLQSAHIQSNVTEVEMPVAQPAATQTASAVAASQPMWVAPAFQWDETVSNVARTNIDPSGISQPAAAQSNVVSVQKPVAGPAMFQGVSTDGAVRNTGNDSLTGPSAVPSLAGQANIASATGTQIPVSQPAVLQSTATAVQVPLAAPSTTQRTSTVVASPIPQNAPGAGSSETVSVRIQASTAPASVPQQTAAQSKETELENTPVSVHQPAAVQSIFASVRTLLAPSATAQDDSSLAVGQPAQNSTAAQWNETESSIPRLAADQSTVVPVQTPVAGPTTSQEASIGEISQSTLDARAIRPTENQAVVPQVSISQPAVVLSNVTPAQTPSVQPLFTQTSVTNGTLQSAQNLTTAKLPETESTIATTEIAQPAVVQSHPATAQTSSVQLVTTQKTEGYESVERARNSGTTEVAKPQPSVLETNNSRANVSHTSISQKAVIEPAAVESIAKPLGDDSSLSSSTLPVNGIQETAAPIAASQKSASVGSSVVAAAVPNAIRVADHSEVQGSYSSVAPNASPNAAQSAVANDPTEPTPVPVLRESVIASVKDVVASAMKTDSTAQATSHPSAADQSSVAETIEVPNGIPDRLAVPPQAVSIGTTQANVMNLKPASAVRSQASASVAVGKGTSTDQASARKVAEPSPESGSKSNSQDAASNGNQNQSGNASQAQIATPVPVSFTVHPAAVIAAAQNAAPVAANHTASATSDANGVATKAADNTQAHTADALPQAAPVINTARLIQNMGQAEMRVGIRSNEFGNISISTSSSRDQVSAQISVEHGELAKALTAHLPEMQARLGSSQPMDVRIDMNGAATGQGTGNFGGMSNDTAGQSRGGRQQAGNIAAGQSDNSVVEQQFSPVVAAVPSGYARLDIRV